MSHCAQPILAFLLYFTGLSHSLGAPGTSPFIGPENQPMAPTSRHSFGMRTHLGDQLWALRIKPDNQG